MEMNRLKPTVLASVALLSVACSSNNTATEPSPASNDSQNGIVAGNLEVSVANGALKLRNTTERKVGYMAVDKDQMVVALYPPCGTNCPIVTQGQTASVPFSQISGYTSKSTEAVVMWWKYTQRADGSLTPEGAVQTTRISLK